MLRGVAANALSIQHRWNKMPDEAEHLSHKSWKCSEWLWQMHCNNHEHSSMVANGYKISLSNLFIRRNICEVSEASTQLHEIQKKWYRSRPLVCVSVCSPQSHSWCLSAFILFSALPRKIFSNHFDFLASKVHPENGRERRLSMEGPGASSAQLSWMALPCF